MAALRRAAWAGALLLTAVGAMACGSSTVSFETTTAWVHFDADSIPLTVEIARTERQQIRGLSRRDELDPDAGMLFVFDQMRPASAGFWMWQTRIPLDAAFMDGSGVIFKIRAMEPCESPEPEGCPEYTPGAPYRFALEVNRGWFSRNGVGVGARVTFEGGPEPEIPPPDPLPTDGPTATAPDTVSPPDPEDPFFLHPRLLEEAEFAAQDPNFPFEPGATSWELFDDLPFTGTFAPAPTPERLLALWSDLLSEGDDPSPEVPIEVVTRIRERTPDSAVGAVLRYGYMDDSVAGEGWYLRLLRTDEGWIVEDAARRWYCRRGAADSLCL